LEGTFRKVGLLGFFGGIGLKLGYLLTFRGKFMAHFGCQKTLFLPGGLERFKGLFGFLDRRSLSWSNWLQGSKGGH